MKTEEIIQIAKEKNLKIINPNDYVNLETINLIFECDKGHTFIGALKGVKYLDSFQCPICAKQQAVYVKEPPKKSGYRIIGFDQATNNFGVSVYDDDRLVYFDVIHFKGETEERLLSIAEFIGRACDEWQPDYVMFEDIQLQQNQGFNGYKTFKVLAELMGVVKIILTLKNVPHNCVLNKVWQAPFGIEGRDRTTQKANVIKKVKELFNVDVTDDVADAILIGKYAVNERNKKKEKLF